jgi:hypothetical protein
MPAHLPCCSWGILTFSEHTCPACLPESVPSRLACQAAAQLLHTCQVLRHTCLFTFRTCQRSHSAARPVRSSPPFPAAARSLHDSNTGTQLLPHASVLLAGRCCGAAVALSALAGSTMRSCGQHQTCHCHGPVNRLADCVPTFHPRGSALSTLHTLQCCSGCWPPEWRRCFGRG